MNETARILYVDDSKTHRYVIGRTLEGAGFTVMTVSTGAAALDAARSGPDIIILDVCLPDIEGFEVCRRLRSDPVTATIPILHLSARRTGGDDKAKGLEGGADAYLVQPVEAVELLATVRVLMRTRRAEEGLRKALAELSTRVKKRSAELAEKSLELTAELAERSRVENALRDTELRYRAIFNLTTQLTWLLCADGSILEVNEAALALGGAGRADVLGQPFWESAWSGSATATRERLRVAVLAAAADGLVHELVETAAVGTRTRILDLSIKPVRDGSGKVVIIIAEGRDTTEARLLAESREEALRQLELARAHAEEQARLLREQAEELMRARDEAVAASRAKTEFVANTSHELRTPLTAIIGISDLLLETRLDATQIDHATTLRQSAEALLTILNDLLDISKIEAGKHELSVVPFDLREVIADVSGLFSPQAQRKGLRFFVDDSDALPSRLLGDPLRIRQILVNLVGNAVKFTDCGEIELSAHVITEDERSVAVRLAVRDTGAGIPEEEQHAIFERYAQANARLAKSHDGTGLGLDICRQWARLMGGQISVQSRPGCGSIFALEVTLPRASDASSPPFRDHELATSANPYDDPIAARVLVVDDHVINRGLIARMLECLGSACVTVGTGTEAVEATQAMRFDLILMDLQLSDMTGLEAVSRIRAREAKAGGHVPILAFTGYVLEDDGRQCFDAGMDGYLCKPVRLRDLKEALARWARPVSLEGMVDVTPATSAPDPGPLLPNLIALCDGSREFAYELLETFWADGQRLVDAVNCGLQARDFVVAAAQCHALGGVCATIGARELGSQCRALEAELRRRRVDQAEAELNRLLEMWEHARTSLPAEVEEKFSASS
jgi:PAS domain S-box-containing protein